MSTAVRNKKLGFAFERELRDRAKAEGLHSDRAWGSNGTAIGEAETVDVRIAGYRIQAKRREKLASFLFPPPGADLVALKKPHKPILVVMPLDTFFDLVKSSGRAG